MFQNFKMYMFGKSPLPFIMAMLVTISLIVARFNREHPQFFWSLLIFAAVLVLAECFVFTRFVRDFKVKIYQKFKTTPGYEEPEVIRLFKKYALLTNIKNVLITIGWAICVSFSRSILILIPFFIVTSLLNIPIRRHFNHAMFYIRRTAGLTEILFSLQ